MNNIIRYNLIILPILITLLTILPLSCSLFCDEDIYQNYDHLRDITEWTIDTLELTGVEDMYLRTFWGSSADDLYIVGSSSENLMGSIWHYDGNEWSPVLLHTYQGGEIDGLVWVEDIWGFGKNDVYIVGLRWTQADDYSVTDSSFVVHYNGSEWKEIKVNNFGIGSIGGTGPNDIWLGGILKGNLSHYDGKTWKNYNDVFPEELYYGIPNFEDITRSEYNKIYAIINNYTVFPYLVSTDGTEWKIEYTFDEFKYYKLNLTDDGTLYSYGFFDIPLSIWNNGSWQPIFIEENFYPGASVSLDNDNQLIAGIKEIPWIDAQNHTHINYESRVFHYNTTDFIPLEVHGLTDTPYGIWSDGNEIFIASQVVIIQNGVPLNKTTIIHGR